ncbi:MAG: DUF2480 family protein [Chitinophagales bacterium]
MADVIVNRVAKSGLITFNLEHYYPEKEIVTFDIKSYLYMELMLKEKDFRTSLKELDWSAYQDKHVAITCTTDAIVPIWAYMVIASYLEPVAASMVFGDAETLKTILYNKALSAINPEDYRDKRVVIKGCGEKPVPISAYAEITRLLKPVVKSLMYGEPCSTVPIYKQRVLRR